MIAQRSGPRPPASPRGPPRGPPRPRMWHPRRDGRLQPARRRGPRPLEAGALSRPEPEPKRPACKSSALDRQGVRSPREWPLSGEQSAWFKDILTPMGEHVDGRMSDVEAAGRRQSLARLRVPPTPQWHGSAASVGTGRRARLCPRRGRSPQGHGLRFPALGPERIEQICGLCQRHASDVAMRGAATARGCLLARCAQHRALFFSMTGGRRGASYPR